MATAFSEENQSELQNDRVSVSGLFPQSFTRRMMWLWGIAGLPGSVYTFDNTARLLDLSVTVIHQTIFIESLKDLY